METASFVRSGLSCPPRLCTSVHVHFVPLASDAFCRCFSIKGFIRLVWELLLHTIFDSCTFSSNLQATYNERRLKTASQGWKTARNEFGWTACADHTNYVTGRSGSDLQRRTSSKRASVPRTSLGSRKPPARHVPSSGFHCKTESNQTIGIDGAGNFLQNKLVYSHVERSCLRRVLTRILMQYLSFTL